MITELKILLELRYENDIELHLEKVRKRGNQIKIGDNEYIKLSDLDTRENSINKELKRVKYRDLEDMADRLQLTYDEIVDTLDVIYRAASIKEFTLVPGIYEVTDINMLLKSLLPEEVKVINTMDNIRLNSNLTTNKTIRFTKNIFFYVIIGFTQSHSGELGDFEGFVELIPGSFKSNKPINITRVNKVHQKADCIQGSIVNGVREAILYSFALSSPPGHKFYKELSVELF